MYTAAVLPATPRLPSPDIGSQRSSASALGLLFGVVSAGLFWAWQRCELSLWTAALAAATALWAVGFFACSAGGRSALRLVGAGTALSFGVGLWRAFWVSGSERVQLTHLPADSGPGILSKLYPEEDSSLLAVRLSHGLRRSYDDEQEQARLVRVLRDAYARTDPPAASVPTPASGTYLGLQDPAHFDTLVIRPPAARAASDAAVVFLQGYPATLYVHCWQLAQAAADANLLVLCPAIGAADDWSTPRGEQTLRVTLEYAHRIGMNRIYLAGLREGAAGASVLALALAPALSGLVLISGLGTEQAAALPTLLLRGEGDRVTPRARARAYAARSASVKYRELEGGDWAFLSEHERARSLLSEFLVELERRAPGSPAFTGKPKR